jgi:ATP-dependent DNA helicase 2 subunit 2
MSIVEASTSSAAAKGKAPAEDSETEDEEEEELLLDKKKPTPPPKPGVLLPTPARSVSPQVNPGRAPGRIVGSTYPLKDFQKNISQGDVVTKAVEDLAAVIAEVVMKPFASRRTQEMLECMEVLRKTCLEVRYFFCVLILFENEVWYISRRMKYMFGTRMLNMLVVS